MSLKESSSPYQFDKNAYQGEELVRVGNGEYPKSVVEKAQRIAADPNFLEEAVYAVLVFEDAERHAKPADPNEPIRAFFVTKLIPNNKD